MPIIIIILLIFLYKTDRKIKELQKENYELKKELLKYKKENVIIKDDNVEKNIYQENIIKHDKKLQKNYIKENNEKKEKESKNTIILITGAILIILAAIVFLTSTWYSIPNILKISVLMLLITVFLYGSKISKDKFKLEKTSMTFFYMAMAYIPICLLSISFFGLLGEYLSIGGNGKFVYLMFSAVFTAIIYYLLYKKKQDFKLFIGSILTQIFSIIMFTLIFSEKIELISLNLLLYNILLITLLFDKNNMFIKYICGIIPYISIGLICLSSQNITFLIPMNLLILALNFFILEIKEKNNINSYMFNIAVVLAGIYYIWIMNSNILTTLKTLFTLIYLISIYIIQNVLDSKSFKKASSILTYIALNILLFKSFILSDEFFKPYVISIIQMIILFNEYIRSKDVERDIISFLIPIYFILAGIILLLEYKVSYYFYIIFSVVVFFIGELLRGNELLKLKQSTFIISNIFIILSYAIVYCINKIEMENDVIYFIVLVSIQIYSYLKSNKCVFKYLIYLSIYGVIFSIAEFFFMPEEIFKLIPTIMLVVLLYLENKKQILVDEYSMIFFQIIKAIAYLSLISLENEIGAIISVGLSIYLIYYQNKNNEKVYTNLIPILGTMPAIFNYSINTEFQIFIMLLSVMGLIYISLINEKNNIYMIFSGLYLLISIERINIEYLNEIIFIMWSLIYWYFYKNEKKKDIFKFLSIIGVVILYNRCAEDLNLNYYIVFAMLGYIVALILTIRTILIKYINKKNLDILEAIIFVILYCSAIMEYANEYDGMLFGLLIVVILIISYLKKYGSMFLVSAAGILLNVFLLTREFWFSVPWWIYLLVLGSILISFAVKNEVNEKTEKFKITDTIKKIKNKIEE